MKRLLRLYPRAWRERYSAEVSALVEDLRPGVGVALDLLIGAGAAYASVIRANRILSSAAAYLHGICVAVLVQAIVFVSLILVSQRSQGQTVVELGPLRFAAIVPRIQIGWWLQLSETGARAVVGSLPALGLLMLMVAVLVVVVAVPRLLRRSTS
jgi:hypothetical protein